MFREIRTRERISEETEKKHYGYMDIKPEKKMTMKEMEDFWKAEFQRIALEASKES